jgi:hypothetical protein
VDALGIVRQSATKLGVEEDQPQQVPIIHGCHPPSARRTAAREITNVGQRAKRLSCDHPPKDGPVEGT